MADEKDIQELIEKLSSWDWRIRFRAALALQKIAEKNPECDLREAVPSLIGALKDDKVVVQATVGNALVEIGKPAVLPLIDALKDDNEFVRMHAALALKNITKKAAEEGDHQSALTIIKKLTSHARNEYEGKKSGESVKRKRELAKLGSLAQQIYDKMNPDKKKFPVKYQPVRTIRKQVIRSG